MENEVLKKFTLRRFKPIGRYQVITEKRNWPTLSRRMLLQKPGQVYLVRCPASSCNCADFGHGCRRGFFSLWIQAIYGIFFAGKFGIPGYIDFGDKPYLYTDPARFPNEHNFWNYYYQQQQRNPKHGVTNSQAESYPLRIWKRSHLREINQRVVRNLKLQDGARRHVADLVQQCKKFNTLGVHIRGSDHGKEVPAVHLDEYLKLLRNSKGFDKFFVATDDIRVLNYLIDEFGIERLIYQNAVRSDNLQGVHTNFSFKDRYRLGLEVLADCHALSACRKAILVHSNVSYGALLLNPELSYHLLETKESLYKRWKTNIIYLLDRWGVRKM